MATEKPKAEYGSTMAELYTICRMGWNSFIANITDFTDFLTIYTPQFGQDALDEIDAAEAMPEFQERNEQAELALVDLKAKAKIALKQWRSLRNYIRASFPIDDRKAKWESAGSDHYEKAANQNWSELRNMLTAGSNFIAANTASLTAGGMPPTFVTAYNDARTAFNASLITFTDNELNEVEGTDLKVVANNAIYHKLIDMFDDGVLIFEDVPAKRERFVFAHLKALITTPTGTDTEKEVYFKGLMSDALTSLPIPLVSFIAKLNNGAPDLTVTTDTEGAYKFKFSDLATDFTGNVTILVTLSGYQPYTATIAVQAGEAYIQDIALDPIPPQP